MVFDGPMIIEDFGSTIRVLKDQSGEIRPSGVIVLTDSDVDR